MQNFARESCHSIRLGAKHAPQTGWFHMKRVMRRFEFTDFRKAVVPNETAEGAKHERAPDSQNEIYFIVRGRDVVFHDGKRNPFEPGDVFIRGRRDKRDFRRHRRRSGPVTRILRPPRWRGPGIGRGAGQESQA